MHFSKPLLGTQLDWSNPLNRGCVMHLACNEGHGDKVQDLSLNGNHGTLHNFAFPPTAASGWNPGQTGVGLKFDGTGDYVNCGNKASLNIADALTISVCIKRATLATRHVVFAKREGGAGNIAMSLEITSVNKLYFNFQDSLGNSRAKLTTNAVITDMDWHNIIVTHDKNSGTTFYWDNNSEYFANPYNMAINTHNLYVGKYSTNYHNGIIDQVRFTNRPWMPKEVKDYAINPWQVYLDDGGI